MRLQSCSRDAPSVIENVLQSPENDTCDAVVLGPVLS
jgi:hypothetical protein